VYKKDQTQKYEAGRTSYTPFSITPFSITYNKTHKSRKKYKIKYLYKTAQQNNIWT